MHVVCALCIYIPSYEIKQRTVFTCMYMYMYIRIIDTDPMHMYMYIHCVHLLLACAALLHKK